jgi:hypothetical protein
MVMEMDFNLESDLFFPFSFVVFPTKSTFCLIFSVLFDYSFVICLKLLLSVNLLHT